MSSRDRHEFIATMPTGRVVRYKVDEVGNDLTARLAWCATHHEPVWVYGDGSYKCPHDRIVQVHSDDHDITNAPWEHAVWRLDKENDR